MVSSEGNVSWKVVVAKHCARSTRQRDLLFDQVVIDVNVAQKHGHMSTTSYTFL